MFPYGYRNTRGSLGELEIAWKHFFCTILVQSLKSEEKLVGRGMVVLWSSKLTSNVITEITNWRELMHSVLIEGFYKCSPQNTGNSVSETLELRNLPGSP